jgi:Na+/melibiose symporter and related transporters
MIVLLLVTIASPFFIKNVIPNRKMKLDLPSLIISTIGFGVFLWSFTNVATDGWGDFKNVILPMIIGLIFIVLFVLRQLKMDEPFVDVRVFKNTQFSLTTVAVMMAMMAMMGVEMMLPTYLQNVHSLSPLKSGLVLLPGALMMGVVAPFAGKAYDRIGAKRLSLIGFGILAIGTLPYLFLTPSTPDHFITALYAVRMFGIAMAMMPLSAMAMSVLPPAEAAHATAANNTARQVASAVVVALLSSVTQNVISNNEPAKALQHTNPLQYGADYLNASMKGFHVSFAIGLAFAFIGIAVAFFLKGGKIQPVGLTNHKPTQDGKED